MSQHSPNFRDSQEAAFQRIVRSAVRNGPFTKGERDVVLAIINHWFHHKTKNEPIHPGRGALARKAKVTEKTVSRTLGKLRAAVVLIPVSNLKGGYQTATRYRVNIPALMTLCGCDWLDQFMRGHRQNVPVVSAKMSRLRGDKMSHGIKGVESDPSQDGYLPIDERLIDYRDDFGGDPDA